ncbi:MAG: type II secretion system F family protein [Thermoleophilia bacterium]|nr:type II secretion system F family protein [Thermoleophilia bacterium]
MFVILLFGLLLAAAGVTLLARALALPRVRVAETIGQIEAYGFETPVRELDAGVPTGSVRGVFDGIADVIGATFSSLGSSGEADIRNELRAGGFYNVSTRTLTGYRVLSGVLTSAVWLWFAGSIGWPFAFAVVAIPVVGLTGWQLPVVFIRNRARKRLERIDDELPELIDLLVVTVEAGLGFNGSLQVAAERLSGPLGEELRVTLQEQRMGLTTSEAMRNLLDRCETPGMRGFVRSVVQGETLGISIGQIMRDLAIEMRKRRRQKAEERAQKAPIKILFPLIFLIFPAMFVILLAPAIFAFIDAI